MNLLHSCGFAAFFLFLMGGCSSPGSAAGSSAAGNPAVASNSGSDKVYTGKEAKIKAELDQTGRELAGRAGRTLMPSKSKPNVVKAGKKNYLAKYLTVDQNSVTTSLRPGTTASTPYVGVIQYDEVTMECRGATKAAAMSSSDCSKVSTTSRKELIRYDGKSWQF